jgi:hypothetical protein
VTREGLARAVASREAKVEAIAKRLDVDPIKLATVINKATYAYDGPDFAEEEGLGVSDRLDKISAHARALIGLLACWPGNLNRTRLVQELSADDDGTGERVEAAIQKLDDMLSLLEDVCVAAAAAHQTHDRGRGRPAAKAALRAAYQVLADFWIEAFGPESFTQQWQLAAGELVPANGASCFLFEAVALFDRGPRLAEKLRALMIDTVAELPGRRRGRRT